MSEATIKYRRRRSGTARWHLSAEAVTLSVMEIADWTPDQCIEFLVKARFGSWDTVLCPHCGTVCRHHWRKKDKRWTCRACDSGFSVTSGTVFANRKQPLREMVAGIMMWINSPSGQPALEMRRHMKMTYNAAFTLQHKMREGFLRGYNVGLMSGDLEMDGSHQSGRRAAEKRGKPQGSRPFDAATDEKTLNEAMLTQTGRMAQKRKKPEGALDPEFGRRLPKDRRIVLALRQRSGVKGKGACATRVAVGTVEDATVAESVLRDYVAVPESLLNTDSSPAYTELGKRFVAHRTVEHAKELIGPNGENNNLAEELHWRQDRAERGIYLNIEPKYLLDYAVETAFRSDTRRLPNGTQLMLAFHVAMSVGESRFWKGFTHGFHRKEELTHPAPRPAKASGPKKGYRAGSEGRPPR